MFSVSMTLAALLLLAVGGYFTFRFRAFYLVHPLRTLRAMPFAGGAKQMLLSLGGTVGVGNIAGVAVAIGIGGSGAVFWMWMGALVSMALKYAEILLGMLTRRGTRGGAAIYIRASLGALAAAVFTLLLLTDAVVTGGVIQSAAIAEAAKTALGISPAAVGAFVSLLAAAVFFFRTDLFALSAYVVPVMSVGYALASVAVIVGNAEKLPEVLRMIFADAFSVESAKGGALGFLFSPALRQGIVKGMFSNEAGCGTAPTAHVAAAETNPARQGLFGILEVFVDTVVMCTLTALVLLLTVGDTFAAGGGIAVCMQAFSKTLGNAAPAVLCVFVFLFAFSAIVAFGYYGLQTLRNCGARPAWQKMFLFVYCASLFVGSVATPKVAWEIADAVICWMLLINTTAVFANRKQISIAHGAFYTQIGK